MLRQSTRSIPLIPLKIQTVQWHLVGWAALTCLAFLPEIGIKAAARSSAAAHARLSPWWRHACAAAAAINIAGLLAANSAGFVLGLSGLHAFIVELAGDPMFIVAAMSVFFSAAQLMFWLRERESRTAATVAGK